MICICKNIKKFVINKISLLKSINDIITTYYSIMYQIIIENTIDIYCSHNVIIRLMLSNEVGPT